MSCVQQERGITCGWVAGCGSLDYFGARLDERRAATDAAITKEVALIFPWVSPELVQLRGEVDRAAVHHRHLADGSLTTDAAAADADDAADADAADSEPVFFNKTLTHHHHKAATKLQAHARGSITRKKHKGRGKRARRPSEASVGSHGSHGPRAARKKRPSESNVEA